MTMRPTIFGIQFHPVCIVSVALVLFAGAFVTLQQTFATNTSDQWPSLTMAYEAPGSTVSIGDRTLNPRETVSLRWGGLDDWRAEVTAAESFDTGSAVGVVSTLGSWESFDGTTYTRYNSITGQTYTDTPRGDVPPSGMVHPAISGVVRGAYEDQGTAPRSVSFGTDYCLGADCSGSVDAVAFNLGDGGRSVFTAEGIPLELPDGFRVLKLRID